MLSLADCQSQKNIQSLRQLSTFTSAILKYVSVILKGVNPWIRKLYVKGFQRRTAEMTLGLLIVLLEG